MGTVKGTVRETVKETVMSLPVNISDLLCQRNVESARIEYKADWNPEPVLHSVCTFVSDIDNGCGGCIALDVKERTEHLYFQ